ncbi:hypothetical protein JHK86_011846 [Glycine max]|nr:hypothetical protein JHK86_011846 [Glycine max]
MDLMWGASVRLPTPTSLLKWRPPPSGLRVTNTEFNNLSQEELGQHIASFVKQSVALNRAGAENMKPRQLSDAIHEEVGAICLGQTGKPKREDGAMLSTSDVMPIQRQGETASVSEIDDTLHENEPDFQFTRQRSDGQSLCELLTPLQHGLDTGQENEPTPTPGWTLIRH